MCGFLPCPIDVQAVGSLPPDQLVGLVEAMARTGCSHDGLIRAILERADLTGGAQADGAEGKTESPPMGGFSSLQLLQLAKAVAGLQVRH